jgi:hypothetical protein
VHEANPSQVEIPLPNPLSVTSRRRVRGGAGGGGVRPWERVVYTKPELSRKEEPDWVITACRLPLLPLHRAVVSFHTGKHAPLLFTDAFTSAKSHQGKNRPSPLICGCPRLRAEGGVMSATAPLRTLLVMLAIEPSRESFLQVPPPPSPRAQPRSFLPCFLSRFSHLGAVSLSPSRSPP